MSQPPHRFPAAPLVGLVATVGMAVVAAGRHPQGNIGRLTPFVIATVVLWTAIAGATRGWRAAALTACGLGSPLLLALAGYLLFFDPVPGDCPNLFQSLRYRAGNGSCIDRGHPWLVAGTAVGSVAVAFVSLRVRATRRPAGGASGPATGRGRASRSRRPGRRR